MIVSIKLMKPVKIDVDTYGKFMLNDIKVSIKEVPFVRFAFTSYTDEVLGYIKSVMGLFSYSGHLLEIKVGDNYVEDIVRIRETIPNIAIFVYMDIDDSNVETNELSQEQMDEVCKLKGLDIVDRFMLKDCSKTLHAISADKIRNSIGKISGIKVANIGFCSSPLSFGTNCCLNAERARELTAKYSDNIECALPSANHEGTNTCGCIRYVLVDSEIKAPDNNRKVAVKKEKTTKEKVESDGETVDKKDKPKKLPKGIMRRW